MANVKGNLILPLLVDKTPDGEMVDRSNIGEHGYAENIEYSLQMSFMDGVVIISYYGENDTILSEDELSKVIQMLK